MGVEAPLKLFSPIMHHHKSCWHICGIVFCTLYCVCVAGVDQPMCLYSRGVNDVCMVLEVFIVLLR